MTRADSTLESLKTLCVCMNWKYCIWRKKKCLTIIHNDTNNNYETEKMEHLGAKKLNVKKINLGSLGWRVCGGGSRLKFLCRVSVECERLGNRLWVYLHGRVNCNHAREGGKHTTFSRNLAASRRDVMWRRWRLVFVSSSLFLAPVQPGGRI